MVLMALLLASCGASRSVPELLTLTDLMPRAVGPNDRVDILGRDLPVGQVPKVTVVFSGELRRAGEPAMLDQTIEVENARLERDRVSFDMNDLLLSRFTGEGDGAKHCTFRGRVEVRIPGASNKIPVVGSLKGDTVFDVLPRNPPKRIAEDIEKRAAGAQAFFGWTLEPAAAPDMGLMVRDVRPDSPAAKAGVLPNDLLVSFAGVTALAPSDTMPSGLEGKTTIEVLRGEDRRELTLDTQGFRASADIGLASGVIVLGTVLALLFLFGTRMGRALSWVTHRLREEIARQRTRDGSFVGALLRAATRDASREVVGSPTGFASVAPALLCVGISLSFAVLPFVELQRKAELDVAILYLVSVTALLTMGLMTGGWGTARSFFVRRAKAVLEVLCCELPAACALGAVVVATGSLRVRDVVLNQVGSGSGVMETGAWPWAWNALRSPQLFFLFSLFFVTVLVDPAPTPGSSGKGRGIAFFFAEWTHVFVMCGLGTVAFLGGYGLPGVATADLYASPLLRVLGGGLFLVKCWGLVLTVLTLRASLPRIRPHLVLKMGLRLLLPACVIGVGLTALTLRYPLLPVAERAVGIVTMATVFGTLSVMVLSVRNAGRTSNTMRSDTMFRARVNPLL